MNRLITVLSTFILVFLLVCFMGTAEVSAVPGNAPGEQPAADVMLTSSGINFMPKVNYAQLVINVGRADGSVFQKTFAPGSTPYLDLSSIFGAAACDGYYTYELRVIPEMAKKIRKEAAFNIPELKNPVQRALTQTGHFLVRGGMIVTSTGSEEISRVMDVVHNDDLIVTGSICTGFDCADGEIFGYDTLKLKENNLRIYFEDTSTGTFPANDWRITINDSTDGGANYFSIEDATGAAKPFTIEAGAPAHSLYVEDYGRVGLGTSVPYMELHIADGDTPTVRLDQDGSSGWTAQVWDVGGNETNFFVRDTTNGSSLSLRIQPGTPSSTLSLKSDGKVGIGTWSPAYPMELEITGQDATFVIDRTDGAAAKITGGASGVQFGSQTNHPVAIVVNDTTTAVTISNTAKVGIGNTGPTHLLDVGTNGAYCDGGRWVNGSSRKYKENIRDLSTGEAVEALAALNPVKFYYKGDKADESLGFIAEDVPDLVATKNRKGMIAMDVVAVLTRVLKEQQKTISELKKKISQLEKK